MSVRAVLRALTPLGWGVVLLVMLVVGLVLARGVGLRWDPFNLTERRLETAEARAASAAQDATARRLEVEAGQAQARQVDAHYRTFVAVSESTARTLEQAGHADDADIPLDEDRADRLRAHDRRLCDLAPDVCGAAPAGPAG
jgi:hypothetical protein